MTDRFKDRVGVVTGAARGFGRNVAEQLVAGGARVALVDIDGDELDRVASKLDGSIAVVADVSSEDDVAGYVRAAVDAFGRIDLFHNNAGIAGAIAPITELSLDDFELAMAINVRGVFLGLREVLKVMTSQGKGGAVVNTASTSSFRAVPHTAPYVASKHAVVGLTKVAALDVAPLGIRVNAVAPGASDTRMISQVQQEIMPDSPEEYYASFEQNVPIGRLGRPEEIANLVTWLLSDEASFVTGATYLIDGGLRAR
jgi:NAD(P)-dependent dehydrogenase (short-subunit alcohol dehydrogenase family)